MRGWANEQVWQADKKSGSSAVQAAVGTGESPSLTLNGLQVCYWNFLGIECEHGVEKRLCLRDAVEAQKTAIKIDGDNPGVWADMVFDLGLVAGSTPKPSGIESEIRSSAEHAVALLTFRHLLRISIQRPLNEVTSHTLLTCPLLESMPRHLWEIAAQVLDVGGIPCAIEPAEHPSHIFALVT